MRYPSRVATVTQTLRQLLPGGSTLQINVEEYHPMESNNANFDEFLTGSFLIQFDPQQRIQGSTNHQALVRVYIEGKAIPDLTWTPLPNQIPARPPLMPPQKRRRDLEERGIDCNSVHLSAVQSLESVAVSIASVIGGGLFQPPRTFTTSTTLSLPSVIVTTAGVTSTDFPLVVPGCPAPCTKTL